MRAKETNSTWKKIRKLFNNIHLWLGIGAGLILFVVCLTGTIYTFSSEIQEALNPERYEIVIQPNAERLAAETITQRVEQALPEGKVTALRIPADEAWSYEVSVKKEGERRGTTYLVDPYTAEIKGTTQGAGSEFFMMVFRLHRWLLLDTEVGRPIVGVATLIFVFIILTGLVIWFPQRLKSWKQGLRIKFSGSWKRTNHDLHNALGFYSSFLLLIMALTGLQWSFEWYRTGLYNVLGVERNRPDEEFSIKAEDSESTLLVADFLRIANEQLPYEGDYRISFSDEPQKPIVVTKYQTGFFAPSAGDVVKLNPYTAEVLKLEVFSEKPWNERVARSIKALHMGTFYGTFSKIIYFIACLIATSLPVTGTIIWINKLRKKAKRKPSQRKAQLV
ncbi:MAG: PepSY-associated TM helix domain-containing protein [Tunicatimonas sp.]|uniref:PepSY-associated TM helix domain-containing protein n=1 Tax=Tunicatimonas sp. TaxID=1940096 RepID=UPI003C71093D